MTYCVAVRVDQGLVFVSDSRTNAGVDHISTYGKMHKFLGDGERFFTLLTAGNLATSRAVVNKLRRDIEEGADESLATVARLTEAADYVGRISVEEQRKYERRMKDKKVNTGASFIVGGQLKATRTRSCWSTPKATTSPSLGTRLFYRSAKRSTESRSSTASSSPS